MPIETEAKALKRYVIQNSNRCEYKSSREETLRRGKLGLGGNYAALGTTICCLPWVQLYVALGVTMLVMFLVHT